MSESHNDFTASQLEEIADRIDQVAYHDKQIIKLSFKLQKETEHLRTLAKLLRSQK